MYKEKFQPSQTFLTSMKFKLLDLIPIFYTSVLRNQGHGPNTSCRGNCFNRQRNWFFHDEGLPAVTQLSSAQVTTSITKGKVRGSATGIWGACLSVLLASGSSLHANMILTNHFISNNYVVCKRSPM